MQFFFLSFFEDLVLKYILKFVTSAVLQTIYDSFQVKAERERLLFTIGRWCKPENHVHSKFVPPPHVGFCALKFCPPPPLKFCGISMKCQNGSNWFEKVMDPDLVQNRPIDKSKDFQ